MSRCFLSLHYKCAFVINYHHKSDSRLSLFLSLSENENSIGSFTNQIEQICTIILDCTERFSLHMLPHCFSCRYDVWIQCLQPHSLCPAAAVKWLHSAFHKAHHRHGSLMQKFRGEGHRKPKYILTVGPMINSLSTNL